MPDDYAKLEAIATEVVKEQRRYVLQMLDAPVSPQAMPSDSS